jgi:5'-nucleotidase
MNDVYELLPLDSGRKGGLARVAYMRQLLLNENNNTITVLAGDLVSPSALGTANVNGTILNGKQMIRTMNILGLDYMTFGDHEFDLSETDLLARMNESTFTWISSNVFRANSSEPFGSSITHKIITIDSVRILIIAFTLEETGNYIRYINQSSLVNYTKQFSSTFPNGTYNVLVALIHLDIATDIELAVDIPQMDLIMGGHEHEDYYYLRGIKYTPIYKADANAFTIYIHRCACNIDTR